MYLSKKMMIILGICLVLISGIAAQDTLLINYQGYLTESSGDPINGSVVLTFTIYSTPNGITSWWGETHPSVEVTNGLFSVLLGSKFGMSKSIFDGSDRWLGISVNYDGDIQPRTLFTGATHAAVSNSVVGHINTLPGIIEIYSPDDCVPPEPCGPRVELAALLDTSKFVLHPPDPCVPPDPCHAAVEIVASNHTNEININKPLPEDGSAATEDNIPAIKLKANNENMIEMYYPGAEADEGVVQIGSNDAEGAFLKLHAHQPLTLTRVMMGGSTTDTGFVRLFAGPNDAEYKLLELNSHTNAGGSARFFDPDNIDGREVLRMGSFATADLENTDFGAQSKSSSSGFDIGIYGFNPQPEPPGHIAFELTSQTSDGPGGRLAVYNTDDASVVLSGGLMQIGHKTIAEYPTGTFGVTATTSQLTLTGYSSVGVPQIITMMTSTEGANVGIGTEAPADELYVVGDITATGAITEISSLKFKTNINRLDNALDMVDRLRGVSFDWRTADYPNLRFSEDQQIGLIAEEVETVIPQLVHSDNNGDKSVDYSKLTAVLIEAVKELKTENNELRARINALENKRISN